MDIIKKIELFVADIYFKLPNELNKDFVDICTGISEFFDNNYQDNKKVMEQKNELLEYLLKVMETNDYIKMADALYYKVKPIFENPINEMAN